MASIGQQRRRGIIERFFSRLRFPQAFGLLLALFAVDFLLPDPIPFIDEIIIGLLAILLGLWKERRDEIPLHKPAEKNITPPPGNFD